MTETTPAGATPAAAGAMPAQSAGTEPAAQAPATGTEPGLGDAGQRALAAERTARRDAEDRAKAAEKIAADLKLATASDQEKAIAKARQEAEDGVRQVGHAAVRREAVRAQLAAAGINPSVLDLAIHASEFATLKVGDDWTVEGLAEAVASFKKAKPDLFGQARGSGSFDTGQGAGRAAGKRTYTREELRDPVFFAANKADILQAMQEGRIKS